MKAAFGGFLGPIMKAKAKTWADETPNIKSLPEHVKKVALHKIIRKHMGKGGPIPSAYSQAASPINLLKSSPIPPTVPRIPKSNQNSSAGK